MLKIELTPELKSLAKQYNDMVLSTPTIKRANYTGVRNPDRYYIGYLGELAFKALLETNNVKFDYYLPNLDGTVDDGDFRVYIQGVRKVVDVKTASAAHHRYLMIPELTYRRYKRDGYVAARINGEVCEFWGI